ncbi:MAG TPA: hypothetical protein VGN13_05005 [Solirubrobacteraceae bacterium]
MSAELHHSCFLLNEYEACDWFGEAAAYSASTGCPFNFDATHGQWVGTVETSEGTTYGSFTFVPYGLERTIVVCLYVYAESSSTLVGESHPFDRARGSEVLPQPPPRFPARTTVRVSVRRCQFWPHVWVNGTKNIGGNINWGIYRRHSHRWLRLYGESSEVSGGFSGGRESPGTYMFSARFLGDKNLYPSSGAGSATFTLRHC